jgi:glycosyltransferase involved in cell wall biosynthesis
MDRPLRGAHIIALETVAGQATAGARWVPFDYCRVLRDLGASVEWWALGPPGPRLESFAEQGVPTRALGMPKHSHRFDTSRALAAALAEAAPDLVHAHCYEPGLHASRAKAAGAIKRLIITHHEPRQRWTRRAFAWPYRHMPDLVTAPSPSAAENMRRWFGYPADRVVALQNPVADVFFAGGSRGEAMVAELGLEGAYPVISWVAAFRRGKGHADLVRAFREVLARYPSARLLLVGKGKHIGEVQALVGRLGLADHVIFTGSRSDVVDVLGVTDILACPSHLETLCMAVVEAMAAGRAVVSTAVWGPCDHISDGVDGLLVPLGDVGAMAEALLRVAGDRVLAERLGAAAHEYARRTFSMEVFAELVGSIFQRILASP